ncbi:formyltransferase family protein [Flexibacterium corallicola]|uniref:formyltransferase family protein n=1 Tax=Flexibacterium corallicola TaxID=3037259 RepID=UPI00286F294C|nr:formyltransferase family protein [Pseudovibrio sp. M1P-2-3]
MRIILCSHSSAYTDALLHSFSRSVEGEVVGLLRSTSVLGGPTSLRSCAGMVRRSGVFYAGYLAVVTNPILRLPHVPKWSNMSSWAQKHGAEYVETPNVNGAREIAWMEELKPDYIVSAHFNQIYKLPIIERFRDKLINLHPGKLPQFRGPDPVFHAINAGERNFTMSLHRISEQIDRGEVLAETVVTPKRKTLFRTNLKLFQQSGALFDMFVRGEGVTRLHSEPLPPYQSWPKPAEVQRFLLKGFRL